MRNGFRVVDIDTPEGKPIDHPDLAPLWDEMNDAYLPIFFHSFFYEPPYFSG